MGACAAKPAVFPLSTVKAGSKLPTGWDLPTATKKEIFKTPRNLTLPINTTPPASPSHKTVSNKVVQSHTGNIDTIICIPWGGPSPRASSPLRRSSMQHWSVPTSCSAFVPDVVLERHAEGMPQLREAEISKPFYAGVLILDVSGYTKLTKWLSLNVDNGAEQMSAALTAYFSAMLRIVRQHRGDVYKFAGDALLVLFRGKDIEENMIDTALRAVAELSEYSVLSGAATLSLHAAATCGMVTGMHLGGVKLGGCRRWEWNLHAPQLLANVGKLLSVAANGQVAMPSNLWKRYCECRPGLGAFITEHDASSEQRVVVTSTPAAALELRAHEKPYNMQLRQKVSLELINGYAVQSVQRHFRNVSPSRRSPMLIGANRYCRIVFCKLPNASTLADAQTTLEVVQMGISLFDGMLRQYLTDDKGTVAIAVWGCPPTSSPEDSLRALAFTAFVNKLLPGQVACGATTGFCYTGAIGDSERCEYVVVGHAVNMAARLMGKAQLGTALCDAETARSLLQCADDHAWVSRVTSSSFSFDLDLVESVVVEGRPCQELCDAPKILRIAGKSPRRRLDRQLVVQLGRSHFVPVKGGGRMESFPLTVIEEGRTEIEPNEEAAPPSPTVTPLTGFGGLHRTPLFEERKGALRTVVAALTCSSHPHGAVVGVTAEKGHGKTTFSRHVAASCAPCKVIFCTGHALRSKRCWRALRPLALELWQYKDSISGQLREYLPILSKIAPTLDVVEEGSKVASLLKQPPSVKKGVITQLLLALLTAATQQQIDHNGVEQPTVLILDDTHLFDRTSLTFLNHLVDKIDASALKNFSILCLFDQWHPGSKGRLHDRCGPVVGLEPLSLAAQREFLQHTCIQLALKHGPFVTLRKIRIPSQFVYDAAEKCGGSPMLLKALMECCFINNASALVPTKGFEADLVVKTSLEALKQCRFQAILQDNVDRVTDAATQLLQAAAVTANSFSLPDIQLLAECVADDELLHSVQLRGQATSILRECSIQSTLQLLRKGIWTGIERSNDGHDAPAVVASQAAAGLANFEKISFASPTLAASVVASMRSDTVQRVRRTAYKLMSRKLIFRDCSHKQLANAASAARHHSEAAVHFLSAAEAHESSAPKTAWRLAGNAITEFIAALAGGSRSLKHSLPPLGQDVALEFPAVWKALQHVRTQSAEKQRKAKIKVSSLARAHCIAAFALAGLGATDEATKVAEAALLICGEGHLTTLSNDEVQVFVQEQSALERLHSFFGLNGGNIADPGRSNEAENRAILNQTTRALSLLLEVSSARQSHDFFNLCRLRIKNINCVLGHTTHGIDHDLTSPLGNLQKQTLQSTWDAQMFRSEVQMLFNEIELVWGAKAPTSLNDAIHTISIAMETVSQFDDNAFGSSFHETDSIRTLLRLCHSRYCRCVKIQDRTR